MQMIEHSLNDMLQIKKIILVLYSFTSSDMNYLLKWFWQIFCHKKAGLLEPFFYEICFCKFYLHGFYQWKHFKFFKVVLKHSCILWIEFWLNPNINFFELCIFFVIQFSQQSKKTIKNQLIKDKPLYLSQNSCSLGNISIASVL